MADYRQVYCRMWTEDTWYGELTPIQRYLFIYLFTNPHASVCGMYELPIRTIRFETGMEDVLIKEILSKFERDGKIEYDGRVMWVKNLRKYQATKSPKVEQRIKNDIDTIPECVIKRRYRIYTVSILEPKLINDTDTDTDTEKDTETETEIVQQPAPKQNPAAASQFNQNVGYRNASRLLETASMLPCVPNDGIKYLETTQSMIDKFGEDKTLEALQSSCEKWKKTPRKTGGGYYSVTNFGWVDWAMELLANPGKNDQAEATQTRQAPAFKSQIDQLRQWAEGSAD